jgi:hypothetical protein
MRDGPTGDREKAYSVRMKKSSKAALLSGLVFPGLGHIYLREFFRGAVLVVLSLAALAAVFTIAYQNALLVVDQVVSGNVSMEADAIARAVSDSTSAADRLAENAAYVVLAACWLAGILDSYRLGSRQEEAAG